MIATGFRQVGLALTALFLVGVLVLPYNGGYPLAYGLMGLSLLLIVGLVAVRGRWRIGAAGWCFLAAFALIAIAYVADGDAPFMVNFLFLVAFVPLASWLRRFAAPDSATVVARLALVGTVLSAATAVWQVFGLHETRAVGWGSDPIWSAEAALVLGFLALVGVRQLDDRYRLALFAGPVLGVCIVVLSGSRGPLLAAPVMAFALLLTSFRPWWKQISAAAAVILLVGAAVLPLWPAGWHRVERAGIVLAQLASGDEVAERSAGARIEFWEAGAKAFLQRPLTGHGWSHMKKAAYAQLWDGGATYEAKGSRLRGNKHLHADILDLGVSAGLLGLIAYGLIIMAPLAGALRSTRDSQRDARITGAIVLGTGYFCCGLTYLMFGNEFHTTLYACLAAIVVGFCRDEPIGT